MPPSQKKTSRRALAVVTTVVAPAAAGCSTSSGVSVGSTGVASAPATSAAPVSTSSGATTLPLPTGSDLIHPDPKQPKQPYDRLLAAMLDDIEQYWVESGSVRCDRGRHDRPGGSGADRKVGGLGQEQVADLVGLPSDVSNDVVERQDAMGMAPFVDDG